MKNLTKEIANTRSLTMKIIKNNKKWEWMKINVYSFDKSPYGWTKRNLMYSPCGLEIKNVKSFNDIERYIRNAIYYVYREFSQTEIGELLNEIKKKI